ncbi:MAG: hypothetical protein JNJ77_00575 [Planctomycetia bacterium]|nr:hypothetical protein [Planctomycetia bacterium]
MIQLQGEKRIAVPSEQLYSELADLQNLVKTLPDIKTVKEVKEDHAVVVVAPNLSFVKGELETTIDRTVATPPTHATLQVISKGIGTSMKVSASFNLSQVENETLLQWQAQVLELGGLLKLVPSGLLKGAANKVIEGWLTSLEQRLSNTA